MIQVYQKLNKSIATVNPDLVVEGFDFSGKWVHLSNPTNCNPRGYDQGRTGR